MTSILDQFLWVIYPYISLTIMVVGLVYRYSKDKLRISSESSEILEKRTLRYGSLLFHWGLIVVILGHFAGFLIPISVYNSLGVAPETYHLLAGLLGGIFGAAAVIGVIILLARRLYYDRVRRNSNFADFFVLFLLLIITLLGLYLTLGYNTIYGVYEYRLTVGPWIRGLITLTPNASLMNSVPLPFKIHILISFLLYPAIPFTRLTHLFSLPIQYPFRRPIIVRYRSREYATTRGNISDVRPSSNETGKSEDS
ncbi:respiratory nitrate reductase subunit gamma [Saccharolobus shibatae]|uniref:Respiratory nitrate reductase gamma chain n=1 Tax=Saccharolobus shibatae TaxID=2286 RepID=A0A8F5GWL9_9CREN|nr:respiratory nitrate reductase subunit gamma [Saccharolobus shibatae]QXJ32219.1 Respiratory nitrate reductase gamma chain [Saccharolobus shibatae]QXJ35243.1 Respiratory nitrate reductase gamma chain [Saccharolobus shibatae]